MSKNSDIKNAVRKTKEWKEFRKHLIEKQKVSFISGKKLTKGANCHHLDLHLENCGVFDEDHQVMLNRKDHELVHSVYGDERHRKDWRKIIERLTELCLRMDKYNGGEKMNEEKSLREEIAEVKRLVNDIAAKLNSLEMEMRKRSD